MQKYFDLWRSMQNIDWFKTIGFIRVYDGTRDLVLFTPGKYDAIWIQIALNAL